MTTPRRVERDDDRVPWRVDLPGERVVAPAAADGRLYVAAGAASMVTETAEPRSGSLTALDADGDVEWHRPLDDPPAGRVRSHGGDAYLAVGRSTGFDGLGQRLVRVGADSDVRWQSPQRDAFLSVLDVTDGGAYLGTSDDALADEGETTVAVDAATGEERWAVPGGDCFAGRAEAGTLYVDYANRTVAALDADDGTERWRRPMEALHGRDRSFPTAGGQLFAAVERDGNYGMAALDAADGTTTWTHGLDTEGRFVVGSATAVGDAVVGTEGDGLLFARDAATGEARWERPLRDRVAAPLLAGGTLYAPEIGGTVAAVDAASGDLRWERSVAADGLPTVLSAAGTLLAVVEAGGETRLVGVDAADGSVRWRRSLPGGRYTVTAAGPGAAVVTDAGSVYGVAL